MLEVSALKVHSYLEKRNLPHEIIVTSNGSTDLTASIGRRLQATHTWIQFFELPERSVGKAFRNGIENSRGDLIVCLDIDLSSDMSFIGRAVELLKDADMVVGSKTLGRQRRNPVRVFGSQLYIACSLLLFDLSVSDYSMGAKAFRREAVLPALKYLSDWTGYVLELCLYLHRNNKKIVQIGVECNDLRKSRFNYFHEGWYRFWHLFAYWWLSRNPHYWLKNTPQLKTSTLQ